ncbi:hypothetical protein N1851_033388 [Merluccius polli]|uniref:Uncharacterized protein n=1 Tax=Merluccius polli TaxID=89951 RepID=A0AA47NNM9_MERPO|nr:hypothetical protein N1851_033388 [Merluccius polli]
MNTCVLDSPFLCSGGDAKAVVDAVSSLAVAIGQLLLEQRNAFQVQGDVTDPELRAVSKETAAVSLLAGKLRSDSRFT